jgi:hypothetical protein
MYTRPLGWKGSPEPSLDDLVMAHHLIVFKHHLANNRWNDSALHVIASELPYRLEKSSVPRIANAARVADRPAPNDTNLRAKF